MFKQTLVLTLLTIVVFGFSNTDSKLLKDKDYIFFLHNHFLEMYGLNDSAPVYGRVEYKEILKAFTQDGFIVLSEKRAPNTDVKRYAHQVVKSIDSLLKNGVNPNHITVIGTSKGGYIAQYVSTFLANPNVNYVFIGCFQQADLIEISDIQICGNVLNIYEHTDSYGVSMIDRKRTSSLAVNHFREIALNTGLGHGFLYKALEEWITPSKHWATRKYEFTAKLND